MYKTREEVEKAWPLGTEVCQEPVYQRFYCADKIMFDKIKNWFYNDTVLQTSPHHVTVTRMSVKTIEGYLFNGEEWFPMLRDGRNWEVYLPEEF